MVSFASKLLLDNSSAIKSVASPVVGAVTKDIKSLSLGDFMSNISAKLDQLLNDVSTAYNVPVQNSNFENPTLFGPGTSGGEVLDKSLKNLLIRDPQTKGAFLNPDKKAELNTVAKFMDEHPDKFPPPPSGSWSKEIRNNNFLNESQVSEFKEAMGMIKDVGVPSGHSAEPDRFDNALINTGFGGSILNPTRKEAQQEIASFMDKNPDKFPPPSDGGNWASKVKNGGRLNTEDTKNFNKGVEMLKDVQKHLSTPAHANDLEDIAKPSKIPSLKEIVAQLNQANDSKYDNLLTPTNNGNSKLNLDVKGQELKDVGKFMDQHPEIFGKPSQNEGNGVGNASNWTNELTGNDGHSNGLTKDLQSNNDLNAIDTNKVQKAIDMMKAIENAPKLNPEDSNKLDLLLHRDDGKPRLSQDKGDAYLNTATMDVAEKVAEFMDNNPKIFGKPDSGSWLNEVKGNEERDKQENHLDNSEREKFLTAINLLKAAQ